MKYSFKIGVSLLALSAGMALAQAPEGREQGNKGQGQQNERAAPGVGAEHGQSSQSKERASPEHSQGSEKRVEKPTSGEAKRETQSNEKAGPADRNAKDSKAGDGSRQAESGKSEANDRAKDTRSSEGSRQTESGKNESNDRARASGEHARRPDAGTNTVVEQRRGNDGGGNKRADIKITTEQKTRVHDIIIKDSGLRRYRRNEVNFSINVGTRIPETVVYYDPPAQLIEIDPEFRRYKVIALEDGTLLIVDPETREIVDVIEV